MNLQNLHLTLRILILAEVLLTLLGVSVAFMDEALLPPPLRNYVRAEWDAPWGWRDSLLLALGLPVIVLVISAWVGLWRGWRNARLLYTLPWVVTLPLLALGPEVASGPSQLLDTTSVLVSGMILGLLYFSELRHRYRRDYGDHWSNTGYW